MDASNVLSIIYGHNDKGCPKNQAGPSNPTKVWIPKIQKGVIDKNEGKPKEDMEIRERKKVE